MDEATTEDLLRAALYALLASVLRAPPNSEVLAELGKLTSDDTDMGRALAGLAAAANTVSAEAVEDEFNALFIGVGGSEITPYGSYYLTGFMYEKPLANLRAEMVELGIEPADDVSEPEDHVAALCEMMAGLITGAFGAAADIARQRAFFDRHLGPWVAQFFADLESAESASFYIPVGAVGRLFMGIETRSFEIAA